MFIISTKLSRTKIIIAIALVGVICLSCGIGFINNVFAMEQKPLIKYNSIKANADRIAFLAGFGWEVNADSAEVKEVLIPKEFDKTYDNYNIIQKELGLDLTKYKGRKVKLWTYKVLNYPDDYTGDVFAHMLIYNETVIGGDIATNQLQGFMHGFVKD